MRDVNLRGMKSYAAHYKIISADCLKFLNLTNLKV